jgi:subtilisin-like proprotein convertase family protein
MTIANLTLKITLTYPRLSDLTLYLKAPDGTVVLLSNRTATGANMQETVFDDSATRTLRDSTAPYTGTFRPDGKLATFNGKNAIGTWQIIIQNAVPITRGRFNIATLNFAQNPSAASASLTETPLAAAKEPSFSASTQAFQSGTENVPLLLAFFQEQGSTMPEGSTASITNSNFPQTTRVIDAHAGRIQETTVTTNWSEESNLEQRVSDLFGEGAPFDELMACFESFSD